MWSASNILSDKHELRDVTSDAVAQIKCHARCMDFNTLVSYLRCALMDKTWKTSVTFSVELWQRSKHD